MPEIKPAAETFAKIKVVGIGGAGGNALNRMIEAGIKGVEFIAVNTDVQALQHSKAPIKLHIGRAVTRGLGAGMNPEVGRQAAEESQNEIRAALKGADMVFITCGLGGGTGTGGAPLVAGIAKEQGALTIAVVTKPFAFEGGQRRRIAENGFLELAKKVDTIIIVSNEKLLQIIDKRTSLLDSFKLADNILRQGVQGIAEIITVPGIVNADFADVRAVMADTGSALMGIGTAKGENKAAEAVKAAVNSNLLDTSIKGAKGIVFTITGGPDLGMLEVSEAAKIINSLADDDARIIFGAVIDEKMDDEIKITIVATGFNKERSEDRPPLNLSRPSDVPKTYGLNIFGRKSDEDKPKEEEREDEIKIINRDFKKSADDSLSWLDKKEKEVAEKKDDEDLYQKRPAFFAKKAAPTNFDKSDDDDGDSELNVPAFIRKKMG